MNLALWSKNKNSGFTLLEVLISMAILVFIAFAIFQATTETFKLRDVLSVEGNFYNGIRLGMSVIQQDVALLYSPTIGTPKPQATQDPNNPNPTPSAQPQVAPIAGGYDDIGTATTFWAPAVNNNGVRPSRFIGSENKMSFVSISHVRLYKDSPESQFAKIVYELKPDTDRVSSVLIKTETPNAFVSEEIRDPFRRTFEVLHGIKKLNFLYYLREGETWKKFSTWDSEKEEHKNQYPDVIEVTLEVVGAKNLSFQGIYKFKPEIPLNGLPATF